MPRTFQSNSEANRYIAAAIKSLALAMPAKGANRTRLLDEAMEALWRVNHIRQGVR